MHYMVLDDDLNPMFAPKLPGDEYTRGERERQQMKRVLVLLHMQETII